MVAVVVAPLREKFDHWYSTDHLPWAIKAFKCEKAWRFWSELEPGVHTAVYRFADKAACDAALGGDEAQEVKTPVSPSPIKRTIIGKIEVPGANYEVITAMVEIAPGFKAG